MLSSSRILSVQRFPGKRLYSVSCTIPRASHGKTLTGSQFHRFLSHPRHENAHFGVSLCPFFPFTISDLTSPLKTREPPRRGLNWTHGPNAVTIACFRPNDTDP